MSNPIRVVILEDRVADADLMLHELRRAGFDPHCQRVEIEPDYLAVLETNPDLVLADWSLPQFSGLRALQLMNECNQDIPFIIVSGSIGEEEAVQAMREGADDYLLKDRLTRLGEAVRRALDNKQLREERKQAEEQVHYQSALLERVTDAIVASDAQYRLTAWNAAAEALYGWKAEQVLGRNGLEIMRTEWPEAKGEEMRRMIAEMGRWHGEATQARKDGTRIPVEVSSLVLRDDSGQITGYVSVNRDISERKQAEEALRSSEERFRSLYENAMIGIYRTTPDGRILMANPALVRMLGFQSFEELAQRDLTEDGFFPSYQHQDFQKRIEQRGHPHDIESAWIRKDGSVIFVREYAHLTRDENNQPLYYEGTVEDVTERKLAEDKLEAERILLRTLIDNLPDLIYVMDIQGRKQISNLADLQASGGKAMEDIIGKTDLDIYPPELAQQYWAIDKEVIESGIAVINHEEPGLDSHGDPTWLLSSKIPLRDAQGRVLGLVGIGRDITKRKLTEEALRESELRFRELFNRMSSGVAVYEAIDNGGDFIIKDFNPSAEKIENVSRKDILGKRVCEVFPGVKAFGVFEVFQRVWQTGKPEYFPPNIYKDEKDPGSWRESWVFKLPTGEIVAIYDNVSERKLAEEKLREYSEHLEEMVEERTRELSDAQEKLIRQERLAVLGQISGSVSHELRNPLGVISNAIYYLKLVQPEADEKIKKYHAMIEREVQTADKIIGDLLDFSRLKSLDREPVSIAELVQSALNRFPVPKSIKVKLKVPADLPLVFADPRQIEQVLGNLITNACQAMSQGSTASVAKGGKLTISANRYKQMVEIAVKDNGEGILPENRKKIFEPLFTTKIKGIGLGLAVSKKLAEANGGRIEVQSEPGEGSTFMLFLPIQDYIL